MKFSTSTSFIFAPGASAAIIRRDQCSFTITASGGQSGVVGQLSDSQNRLGGEYPTEDYAISNGQITDSNGRGRILTPSVQQFQCDASAASTSGFSVSSSGEILYYLLHSEYNIYTTPVSGQSKCVEVMLSASSCYGSPNTSNAASTAPGRTSASSSTILQSASQEESVPTPTIDKTTTQHKTTVQQQTQKETVTEQVTKTEQETSPG
ncbi:hypothetical protein ACMFMG_005651 [Clarireedia jacksonii]